MNASAPTYFPPEWAPQSAVLLAWPYPQGDFDPWLDEVEHTYGLIARAVAEAQGLLVVCRNQTHLGQVRARLENLAIDLDRVRLLDIPYDDVWVRDTAPLTVQTEGDPKLLDFRFNGWGNKYEHGEDAQLAARLHGRGVFGSVILESIDFVLEGGSLETDGEGTLLTTARCLLNPNRNPQYRQEQIEDRLRRAFGLERILWLHHGHAEGDDTDAHVDTLARFCSPELIAYTACEDRDDPLFADLERMAEELAGFRTQDGRPYALVPLPIPKPILDEEGNRLPATYANFLIINGAVLVPIYGDPMDELALERLARCFPDRRLVPIPSLPLIRQYGSIHCMSMQFPASVAIS